VILGLGIDVCPVERIEQVLSRHDEIFCERIFTPEERKYAGNGRARAERLAARFAAKEAAIKALGAPEGLRWKDMEVVNDENGAPSLKLEGKAHERMEALGVSRVLISLTHAGGVAMAVVILEGD
jgi:holo-[acyl-carrier protein] synthase